MFLEKLSEGLEQQPKKLMHPMCFIAFDVPASKINQVKEAGFTYNVYYDLYCAPLEFYQFQLMEALKEEALISPVNNNLEVKKQDIKAEIFKNSTIKGKLPFNPIGYITGTRLYSIRSNIFGKDGINWGIAGNIGRLYKTSLFASQNMPVFGVALNKSEVEENQTLFAAVKRRKGELKTVKGKKFYIVPLQNERGLGDDNKIIIDEFSFTYGTGAQRTAFPHVGIWYYPEETLFEYEKFGTTVDHPIYGPQDVYNLSTATTTEFKFPETFLALDDTERFYVRPRLMKENPEVQQFIDPETFELKSFIEAFKLTGFNVRKVSFGNGIGTKIYPLTQAYTDDLLMNLHSKLPWTKCFQFINFAIQFDTTYGSDMFWFKADFELDRLTVQVPRRLNIREDEKEKLSQIAKDCKIPKLLKIFDLKLAEYENLGQTEEFFNWKRSKSRSDGSFVIQNAYR